MGTGGACATDLEDTEMMKLVAAAPALATALGFLLLAGAPAWAHSNLTSTSMVLSANSVTQGTIVTITATVTFTGSQSGGNANGHTFFPGGGIAVGGDNVDFVLSSDVCGGAPVFSGVVGQDTTDVSGVASFMLDTSFFTPGDFCVSAIHNNSGGKHGSATSSDEDDLEILGADGAQFDLSVVKTVISGPLESSVFANPLGCNIDHYDGTDADCDGFATDFIYGPNDDGPVGVTLLDSQHYVFEIKITNNGADNEFDDTVLADTLGADWDMDPTAEEDFEANGVLDGDCTGTDGTCDGNGQDGVILVSGDCTYTLSQPDSASKPNAPPKQPEFLDILMGTFDSGDMCTFLVFVNTVENPGQGNDFFEPTDCRDLEYATDPDGNPIFDTFALNDGIKAFDGTDGDDTATFRLFGPIETLQLYCNFPD